MKGVVMEKHKNKIREILGGYKLVVYRDGLEPMIEELTEAITQSRKDGMEEAAKIAEAWTTSVYSPQNRSSDKEVEMYCDSVSTNIAEAIRQAKEKAKFERTEK